MLPYNYTMQPQFVQPDSFTQPTQASVQTIQYGNGFESANAYRMQPNSEVIRQWDYYSDSVFLDFRLWRRSLGK